MLSKRFGVAGNPHTGFPDAVYSRSVKLGWLRALVLDDGSWEGMLKQVPNGTNVAAVITGQSGPINNDWWSDGWRDRFSDYLTLFCEKYYRQVRLIEFTNEWDFWDNEDKAEKAAEIAILGTNICKKYGILGMLGSVASSDWKNQLARAIAIVDRADQQLGYSSVHGFCFHPYVSYVSRDRPGTADDFLIPTNDGPWERLSDKVRDAINIAGGRPVALTEFGIKVGDAGGLEKQSWYIHAAFEDELSQFTADELVMAAYFCWCDQNGSPGERGNNGFGLIGEHGEMRPAYNAFAYQVGREVEVDLPVATWLARSMLPSETHGTPTPPNADDGNGIPQEPEKPATGAVSIEQAHALRWRAIVPDAEYNHTFGFERLWRQRDNNWWGSPITKDEYKLEDGRPLRIFANAVVVYNEGDGTVEILE